MNPGLTAKVFVTAAGLVVGVGLPALMLLLFAMGSTILCLLVEGSGMLCRFVVVSTGPCLFMASPMLKVLAGRDLMLPPLTDVEVLLTAFEVGSARIVAAVGRINMPRPGSHSKYLCPLTAPSFLPEKSSNSTPSQSPSAKCVSPTKRMTASFRSFPSSIVCPTSNSDKSPISLYALPTSDVHIPIARQCE